MIQQDCSDSVIYIVYISVSMSVISSHVTNQMLATMSWTAVKFKQFFSNTDPKLRMTYMTYDRVPNQHLYTYFLFLLIGVYTFAAESSLFQR